MIMVNTEIYNMLVSTQDFITCGTQVTHDMLQHAKSAFNMVLKQFSLKIVFLNM